MTDRPVYTTLTIAGAAPFIAAAALPPLGFETIGLLGPAAGAHWATFLHRRDAAPTNLFVASNVVVLGVWIPYLLAPIGWTAIALIAAFLYLLYVDYRLRAAGAVDAHYLTVRTIATALAVVSLALVAWYA